MKKLAKIIFITTMASVVCLGCGKQQTVKTELLEPVEELDDESNSDSEVSITGGETSDVTTVETYFDEHPEELQGIIDNMTDTEHDVFVEISDNTVTVKYFLKKEFSEAELENYTTQTQQMLQSEEIANSYKESKNLFSANNTINVEDIVIEVVHFDMEGNELVTETF